MVLAFCIFLHLFVYLLSSINKCYIHFNILLLLLVLIQGFQDQGEKVEFSGPLLSQSHRIDELLERHERQIRQAVRKSWFQRGNYNNALVSVGIDYY